MRLGTAVVIAVVVAGAVHSASPDRGVPARRTAGAPTVRLSVGYTSGRALFRALRASHAVLIRRVPELHVAEVGTVDPARAISTLRQTPGIGAVARTALRTSVSQPGLTLASLTPRAVWDWQVRATHSDTVPESVLRAASSILIAVIDTGADLSAPDLAAKTPAAYNTRTGGTDVRDSNGHGTFVASLAAGSVSDPEGGIAGAGGDARLLVVKSGTAAGTLTDVDEAAGIMYAVDHGAKIVNLSVGGPTTSVIEQHAIDYATQHGVLLVAAVGNEHARGNPVEYPAALLQPAGSHGAGGAGVAVTASSPGGRRASFASTGSWVSLAAPGENVLGAVSKDASPMTYPRSVLPGVQSGLYGYASGTSFAAPQVSGAAALVWAVSPSLTAQQVAQILKETASGGGHWTPQLGFGVIDVAAAIARARAGTPGVLLSGYRATGRIGLNWSGDAVRYSLSLSTDGAQPVPVLSATEQTNTTLALARGHTYSFTVTALDASDVATATSAPLEVTTAATRSRR